MTKVSNHRPIQSEEEYIALPWFSDCGEARSPLRSAGDNSLKGETQKAK
jgi:hypothetical protein